MSFSLSFFRRSSQNVRDLIQRARFSPSQHRLMRPGGHERWLLEHFGSESYYTGTRPVFDHPLYCVLFTNRCGSNLLCDYLRQTPMFSGFTEMLNATTVAQICQQRQIRTFPEYIIQVSNLHRGPNSIYGFKASVEQLAMLIRCNINNMYQGGIRVIHISRQDSLGQAISYQIALQTKAWVSGERHAQAAQDIRCDPEGLNRIMEEIRLSNLATEMLCTAQSLRRISVYYEDLVKDPAYVLAKISAFCDQDPSSWHPQPPSLSQQANEVNQAFRSQYRSYMAAAFDESRRPSKPTYS